MEFRRRLRVRVLLLVATAAALVTTGFGVVSPARAVTQSIPYKINFQGRLTDNNGNALSDGFYNVKFRLFTALSGGSNSWEEDRVYAASDNRVQVVSGLFNIQFGDLTALSPSLFNSSTPLYLEVELPTPATATCASNGCASFTEGAMTPRQPLASATYAFNSDTLDGLDSTAFGQLGTTNTFTQTNTFSAASAPGVILSGSAASGGSLLQFGSTALSSGSTNGTLIGANIATAADLINLQTSNAIKIKVDNSGNLTLAGGVTAATSGTINGVSINAGALSGVTGLTLSSGDITTPGNISTTSTGAISSNTTVTAVTNVTTPKVTTTSGDLTLDPVGNTFIVGSGNTSGTTALSVQNSGTASLLLARNDGYLTVGNATLSATALHVVGGVCIEASDTSCTTTAGNLAVNGGAITTVATTGTLFNTNVTNLSIGGAATAISIGSVSSSTLLKVGTSGTPTLANANLLVTNAEVSTALRIGTTTNGIDFTASGNPVYYGTARPTKQLVLSPEYPGATFSVDGGASTTGTLTSDNDGSADGWRNYYKWSSTLGTNQTYTIIVRATLPADFGTWDADTGCPGAGCAMQIEYKTGLAATTNNAVTVNINNPSDTPGTAVCTIGPVASTSWAVGSCTAAQLSGSTPAWKTAGQSAVIRVQVTANSTASALAQVGDIVLKYKATF